MTAPTSACITMDAAAFSMYALHACTPSTPTWAERILASCRILLDGEITELHIKKEGAAAAALGHYVGAGQLMIQAAS